MASEPQTVPASSSTWTHLCGGSGSPFRRDGGAEPSFPPFEGNDAQGEVEGVPVELFGELCDRDDPRGEVLPGDLAFNLHRRAGCCTATATAVFGRVGGVQQADQRADVAGELDVTV